MSAPIAEFANDARDFALADAMAGGVPLVIRGLCRDWPLVREACRSQGAFAQALAALDAGTPVDVLHMPPEAGGVLGY
ncbi:MAG: cupin-like domain-containing protein, partial [Oxalobacteraceae bacterium]